MAMGMDTNQSLFRINWLIDGQLGGCPRPNTPAALAALRSANTGLLISLTAEWQPDLTALARNHIMSLHIPIRDFTPPSPEQAIEVCRAVETALARNQTTILHCAAGKGRTGTLLTAYLIWQGLNPDAAIKKARSVNPEWIETPGQISFLEQFKR